MHCYWNFCLSWNLFSTIPKNQAAKIYKVHWKTYSASKKITKRVYLQVRRKKKARLELHEYRSDEVFGVKKCVGNKINLEEKLVENLKNIDVKEKIDNAQENTTRS